MAGVTLAFSRELSVWDFSQLWKKGKQPNFDDPDFHGLWWFHFCMYYTVLSNGNVICEEIFI